MCVETGRNYLGKMEKLEIVEPKSDEGHGLWPTECPERAQLGGPSWPKADRSSGNVVLRQDILTRPNATVSLSFAYPLEN
jgi:hypothetical protein